MDSLDAMDSTHSVDSVDSSDSTDSMASSTGLAGARPGLPEAPLASEASEERVVVFTEAAIRKIEEYSESLEEARGKFLRIFVQGGGCSGFEYGFSFDDRKDEDLLVPQGDIHILVDSFSLPYLEGAIVDFSASLMGSGFRVTNPNATGTCGCGHSFTA